jgi:integrase
VFVGETGSYLDGSALRRRYKTALASAGLRPLRSHDLRNTFGTRMIAKADIRRVQQWMGHADIPTTMRYLHYAPRAEDAQLVAEAFAVSPDAGRGTSVDNLGQLGTSSGMVSVPSQATDDADE